MTLEALPERPDGVRLVCARGEIDVVVAPALIADLPGLLEGATGVVLDLSGVTFFDSAGVRLVDQLARECARGGEPFAVVSPPRNPSRRVLELVGLADALVVDDVAAALERVTGA